MNIKRSKTMLSMLVLLITLALSAAAWASPSQKVYDEAGLFSQSEKQQLEEQLTELVGRMNMDFVVLTTYDKEGKTQAEYTDDFYDYGGFGIGDEQSGLLFMIDMEERDCYISTTGDMIDYLSDERLMEILQLDDELWDRLADGKYAPATLRVIDQVEGYYNEGPDLPGEGKSEKKSFNPLTLVGSVLAGLLAGFTRSRNIRSEYGMKNEHSQAMASTKAYMATTAFAFNQTADDLLNTQVTRVPIPRQRSSGGGGSSHPRSSTHVGSSGTTHGGGGSGGRHF